MNTRSQVVCSSLRSTELALMRISSESRTGDKNLRKVKMLYSLERHIPITGLNFLIVVSVCSFHVSFSQPKYINADLEFFKFNNLPCMCVYVCVIQTNIVVDKLTKRTKMYKNSNIRAAFLSFVALWYSFHILHLFIYNIITIMKPVLGYILYIVYFLKVSPSIFYFSVF